MMTTTTKTQERKEFLHDVFVTALEGGIGYWSVAESYHWLDEATDKPDLDGFYSEIVDVESVTPDGRNDGHGDRFRIDADVIVRGVNRIANAKAPYYDPNGERTQCESVPFLGRESAMLIREANRENDASEIDADLADQIVQVGLFGEVRYG